MATARRPTKKATPAWAFRPQGDRCLSLDFGDKISVETGLQCLAAATALRDAQLPGVTDVVPSYTAVAVHFLPDTLSDDKVGAFDALCARIGEILGAGLPEAAASSREVDIPVCYGGRHGPDLADVARAAGLTEDEVIALHQAPGSMVFTLGFAPGLPYIGVHDAALNLPRRAVPRTAVAQGSVAIANRQTTIYPNVLPGGWHIIGATPLVMFDATRAQPALLMPGDRVRFVPISDQDFDRIALEQGRKP